MKNHIIVFGVIDYVGDVTCAALTGEEADSIIADSEVDGGDFYKDTIYLYGEGILDKKLVDEIGKLPGYIKNMDVFFPHLMRLKAYLEQNLK